MNKVLSFLFVAFFLISCSEYQKALKSDDVAVKNEAANKKYEAGKYIKAIRLYEQIAPAYKGKPSAERMFYFYSMSLYKSKQYYLAGYQLENFVATYPRSEKKEEAAFYAAECFYKLSPAYSLDQTDTNKALDKMQKFIDKELGQHYQSAMFKLKSVLQNSDKDWVSSIESKVLVQPSSGNLFNENVPNAMAILFKSVADKTQVVLNYQALEAETASERTIEPVGVFHDNQNWYMLGFCHLRNDYRQFRADRIEGIRKTEIPFTKEHDSLETFLDKEREKPTQKVRLLVDRKISRYLSNDKRHYGFVSEKNNGELVEMTFLVRDLENGIARWFLMFADYATILEPEALKTRVLELMESYRERLQ